MRQLDLTLPSPAENLACDEVLLDWCEENGGEEIIRFWESPQVFAVVGYANKLASEVDAAACAARGVPVLRRCSGGGTVLQGPGCLNYALILRITDDGPLRTITSANQFIMEKNRRAIGSLKDESPVSVCGHTDLAVGGLKFSGNSQRRKRNFLLFHGTFLLRFDLALVGGLLHMPSLQPDYRESRSHGEFITNLNLPAETVKAALAKAWNADGTLPGFPMPEIQKLAARKYSTDGWNLKF